MADLTREEMKSIIGLEVPTDLAFLFNMADDVKSFPTGHVVIPLKSRIYTQNYGLRLPEDINNWIFSRYSETHFQNHVFLAKRTAITHPFLIKINENDYREAIRVFKLVLRYMYDTTLTEARQRLIANYILQAALKSGGLRDEVYSHLAVQMWAKNKSDLSTEKISQLMAMATSVLKPSPVLYNYLLKYTSDHSFNGYKFTCQHKLLRCHSSPFPCSRSYPPSLLEWTAAKKKCKMALPVRLPAGNTINVHVDSWTTGEECGRLAMLACGLFENRHGWTMQLNDQDAIYELSGSSHVLDLISEIEVPPGIPHNIAPLLVSLKPDAETNSRNVRHTSRSHRSDIHREPSFEEDSLLSEPTPSVKSNPAAPAINGMILTSLRDRLRVVKPTKDWYNEADGIPAQSSGLSPRAPPSRPPPASAAEEDPSKPTSPTKGSRLNERPAEVNIKGLSRQSSMNKRYLGSSSSEKNAEVKAAVVEEIMHDKYGYTIVSKPDKPSDIVRRTPSVTFSDQTIAKSAETVADVRPISRRPSALNARYRAPIPEEAVLPVFKNGDGSLASYSKEELVKLNRRVKPKVDVVTPTPGGEGEASELHQNIMLQINKEIQQKQQRQFEKKDLKNEGQHRPTSRIKSINVSEDRVNRANDSTLSEGNATQISDLDEWVDKMFDPIIHESPQKGLTNTNSLQKSLKGGGGQHLLSDPVKEWQSSLIPQTSQMECLQNPEILLKLVKGDGPKVDEPILQSQLEAASMQNRLLEQSLQNERLRLQLQQDSVLAVNESTRQQAPTSVILNATQKDASIADPIDGGETPSVTATVPNGSSTHGQIDPKAESDVLYFAVNKTVISKTKDDQATSKAQPVLTPPSIIVNEVQSHGLQRASTVKSPGNVEPLTNGKHSSQPMSDESVALVTPTTSNPSGKETQVKPSAKPHMTDVVFSPPKMKTRKFRVWPPPKDDHGAADNNKEFSNGPKVQKLLLSEEHSTKLNDALLFHRKPGSKIAEAVKQIQLKRQPSQAIQARLELLEQRLGAGAKQATSALNVVTSPSALQSLAHPSANIPPPPPLPPPPKQPIGPVVANIEPAIKFTGIPTPPPLPPNIIDAMKSPADGFQTPMPPSQDIKRDDINTPVIRQPVKAVDDIPFVKAAKLSTQLDHNANQLFGIETNDNSQSLDGLIRLDPSTLMGTYDLSISQSDSTFEPTSHDSELSTPSLSSSSLVTTRPETPKLSTKYSAPQSTVQPNHRWMSKSKKSQSNIKWTVPDEVFGVVNREKERKPVKTLFQQMAVVQTELHSPCEKETDYISYADVPWHLVCRKEVFSPRERLENPKMISLVFCQIIRDVLEGPCVRVPEEGFQQISDIIGSVNVDTMISPSIPDDTKWKTILQARKWPFYFARIFPVKGDRAGLLPDVQFIAVGHDGIKFGQRTSEPDNKFASSKLTCTKFILYEDVFHVKAAKDNIFQLVAAHRTYRVYTSRAGLIANFVSAFGIEAKEGAKYVRVTKDLITCEPGILSFKKGDTVWLKPSGFKSEQTSLPSPKPGWLQGSIAGHLGIFPEDYVSSVSRKELSRRGSFQDTRSRHSSERSDDLAPAPSGKYSMLEFSMVYFRENLTRYNNNRPSESGIHGSIKLIESLKLQPGSRRKSLPKSNNKEVEKFQRQESWSWREQADMIKWSKNPILDSLLKLPTEAMNRAAVNSFSSIMAIMGDLEFEPECTAVDCLFRILKACHQWPEMRDETFCQLAKQTTNNKSPKNDSSLIGWRLFILISCWFAPSDLLKPYIKNYLQQNASDPARPHYIQASTALQLLGKTIKYGGRRNVASVEEIGAIMDGKLNRRLSVVLPGGVPVMINITATTVAQDLISEICTKLGVVSQMEQDEYTVFTLVDPGNEFARLKRDEYIMDVITEMKLHNKDCIFMLERTSWYHPLRLDIISAELLNMTYNQLIPDYVDGYILSLDEAGSIPAKQLDDIVTIAALMYRVSEPTGFPTSIREIETMFPGPIFALNLLKSSKFFSGVIHKLTRLGDMSDLECRIRIVEMIRKWPLFGSTFFNVNCSSEPRLPADCMMAMNRAGIHFLIPKTHRVVLSYPFTEVISSRHLPAEDTSKRSFLDIKVGNNKVQKVLRVGTTQGTDVTYLIAQYIKAINSSAKHLP